MLDEIGEASPTAKTTEELKKELNNEKINLTKLHWIKNKSNKSDNISKKPFNLLTIFWTGNVSLNNGTSDTKRISDLTNTILSEADRVTALNNIEAILNGSIEKIKNAPFNIKALASLRHCSQKRFSTITKIWWLKHT